MNTYDMETTIQLPDEEDVDVYIEFEVTSWGSPGCGPSFSSPGEPPDPPEFGITKVVRADNNEDITNLVEELPREYQQKIDELVFQRVCEIDEDRAYGPDD
jgi:hypothetical protein